MLKFSKKCKNNCSVPKLHKIKPTGYILVVPFNIYDKNKICNCNEQKCQVYVFIFNNWDRSTTFIICIYKCTSIFWLYLHRWQ